MKTKKPFLREKKTIDRKVQLTMYFATLFDVVLEIEQYIYIKLLKNKVLFKL